MPVFAALAVAALLALFSPISAHACELDEPHRFEVPSVERPSLRNDARVSVEVLRRSSFPLAPCALHSTAKFRVKNLPPGQWGLLLKPSTSGTVIPVPEWPIALSSDGTAMLSWPESIGLWRGELDELLEASLVDAKGRQTTPRPLRVSASGSPQFVGWAVLVAFVGLVLWGGRARGPAPRAKTIA
jgi:hypothetical protein